ncbi:MAG: peptidoglycan DD-metalloendopeptidase family protein [Oscillospiraceae bacterium]|nr:peptidoglycan DD-metalloendopeptidase family protein [Oscillospiraceae bacterium]
MNRNRKKYTARGRVTQQMTRDGLVQRNEATGEKTKLSKREAEFDIHGNPPEFAILLKSVNKQKSKIDKRKIYKQTYRQYQERREAKEPAIQHEPPKPDMPATQTNETAGGKSLVKSTQPAVSPVPEIRQLELPEIPMNSQNDKNKFKVRKTTSYRHSKTSVLQEKPVVLQHETESEPTFKHEPGEPVTELPVSTKTADKPRIKKKTRKKRVYRHKKLGTLHREAPTAEPPSNEIKSLPAAFIVPPEIRKQQPETPEMSLNPQNYQGHPITEAETERVSSTQNANKKSVNRHNEPDKLKQRNPSTTEDVGSKPVETVISSAPERSVKADTSKKSNEKVKTDKPQTDPKADDAEEITKPEPNGDETEVPAETKPPPDETKPMAGTDMPESAPGSKKNDKLRFTEDETAPENPTNRKLAKAEKKYKRTNGKLEKARGKLPAKRKLRSQRVFNEETGKAKNKLYFEREVKTQKEHLQGALPLRPVKAGANALIIHGHRKLYEVENENVGVKAGHRGEMIAESGLRKAYRLHKTAPYRKVAKLEHKTMKKRINLTYQQTLYKNPQLKSNMFSRMRQKHKIKKDYAKKTREAQKAAKNIKKAAEKTGKAAAAVGKFVVRHPVISIILLLFNLLILVMLSMCGTIGGLAGGGLGGILNAVYLADDADIEIAGLAYSEWETDLRLEIVNTEVNRPGYDEYRYTIGNIGHDPLALMAYLTAVYQDFNYDDIEPVLWDLFGEQYELEFTESVELRHRTEIRWDYYIDDDGEEVWYSYEIDVLYDWYILTVTLTSRPFANVILPLMDDGQLQHYSVLMETRGGRQYAGNPFEFDIMPYISSYYGYRIHPITGAKDLHRGIDIAVPAGTEIRSAQDGQVTFAEYLSSYGNVVVIEDETGLVTKYAHCDTLLVSAGQTVNMGEFIATVGSTGDSTGPHLHFEVLKDGQYLDPLLFAYTGG